MYENIGKKIKGLSKTIAIIEAILAAGIGTGIMFADDDTIGAGVLVVVIGCLAAWVSSWMLYGFGEIIDKLSSIEQHTRTEAQNNVNLKRQSEIERLYSQGMITEEEYKNAVSKNQKE